jgi:hypothetical protein
MVGGGNQDDRLPLANAYTEEAHHARAEELVAVVELNDVAVLPGSLERVARSWSFRQGVQERHEASSPGVGRVLPNIYRREMPDAIPISDPLAARR